MGCSRRDSANTICKCCESNCQKGKRDWRKYNEWQCKEIVLACTALRGLVDSLRVHNWDRWNGVSIASVGYGNTVHLCKKSASKCVCCHPLLQSIIGQREIRRVGYQCSCLRSASHLRIVFLVLWIDLSDAVYPLVYLIR